MSREPEACFIAPFTLARCHPVAEECTLHVASVPQEAGQSRELVPLSRNAH
jgi:hypothetical protein